jgi:hypothetical protein
MTEDAMTEDARFSDASPAPFPWADQPDAAACNLAIAQLVRILPLSLADNEGRIHMETLMTAAGAIAGLGAHISLVSDTATMQRESEAGRLQLIELKDGRVVLFGPALDDMLCAPTIDLAPVRVWNTLAGTAISRGAREAELPDLTAMFAHVSNSMLTEREGWPSTPPDRQPLLNAREALRVAGPLAVQCLNLKPGPGQEGEPAQPTSWVKVTAQAAAAVLSQSADRIAPAQAAQLAMEAAIYTSRLRPVTPGA